MRKALGILAVVALLWGAWFLIFAPRGSTYAPEPISSQAYAARAMSGDPVTRRNAIAELASRRDDVALAALIQMAAEEPQPGFRAAAVTALGTTADRRAAPAVIKALDDKSELVFRSAFWAVGRIADPASLDALGRHLMQEKDRVRAEEAAWTLRDFPGERSERLLLERLAKAPVSLVSLNVVSSLGCVGGDTALAALRELRKTLPENLDPIHDDLPDADRLRYDLAFTVDLAVRQIESRQKR